MEGKGASQRLCGFCRNMDRRVVLGFSDDSGHVKGPDRVERIFLHENRQRSQFDFNGSNLRF